MSDNDKMLSGKLVEETMRIRELEHKNIGPSVMAGDIDDDILVDIMAMCRRRFKKDDILVVVDLSEQENETGIVFTGTELHYRRWCEWSGDRRTYHTERCRKKEW